MLVFLSPVFYNGATGIWKGSMFFFLFGKSELRFDTVR